ncbi:MAG: N-acetyltransferase [bacterium]|nr:N-acetyltransferase [bacterium]
MNIEPIPDAMIGQVATLFQRSFADDPGMRYICQYEQKGYEKRLSAWFLALLQMQVVNQQPILGICEAGDYVACATLTLPQTKLKTMSLIKWVVTVLFQVGFIGLWRTMGHVGRISRYQPKTRHYRLEFIAVHPNYQGKGYGRMLLDKIHQMSETDAHSQGVWLETTNPVNVGLYEHVGYVVENRFMMADEVEAVIMFRK